MGYVYFIEEVTSSDIKIGYSDAPTTRLATLQTGNSGQLRLKYIIPDSEPYFEKYMHEVCAAFNIRGEWFKKDVVTFLLQETSPWFREHMLPIRSN